jgi:ABC-type branched-subunit amino acid transport system substrate-binding protein
VRRWTAGLAALAVLAATACGTTDDDDGSAGPTTEPPGEGTGPTGTVPGVTDDVVRISTLIPDLAPLVDAGLAPDYGDFTQNLQVFADEVNDAGGIGGRRLEMHYNLFPAGATPTDQQASCLAAAQDDDAFVVISTGGTADETLLCVTEQNQRIALVMAGAYVPSIYDRSQGRLFTNGISVGRLMRNMVAMLDDAGELEGRTIGLIRPDAARDGEAADALRAALEDAGHQLAEDVALPCANNRCEQNDVGARRLANAGVDALFSFLGAVTYPAFVGEAEAQGFDPQWFSSDFENQVFATTAQFMAGVAQAYDGAIGTTAGLDTFDPDGPFVDCNARFTEATGIEYEFRTDPWQAVGNSCEMIERIVRVLEAIEDEGRSLDQDAFIEHMQRETVNLGDRQGRFGPDKRDAYDVLELRRFSAGCVCWETIEGTRRTDPGS